MYPRNLQQDSLNGPLNLGIYSNSSSNLLRGPLVRSHSIFDGKYIDNIIIQYIYIYTYVYLFLFPLKTPKMVDTMSCQEASASL